MEKGKFAKTLGEIARSKELDVSRKLKAFLQAMEEFSVIHVEMFGRDMVMFPPNYLVENEEENEEKRKAEEKRKNNFRKKYADFDCQLSMRIPNGGGGFLCSYAQKTRSRELYAAAMSNFTMTSTKTNQRTKNLPLHFYTPREMQNWCKTSDEIFGYCELSFTRPTKKQFGVYPRKGSH